MYGHRGANRRDEISRNGVKHSDRILVLDTTIRGAFAAVAAPLADDAVEPLSFVHRTANKLAAAGISDLCAEALAGAKCDLSELAIGVVGHGPGSFTGIKVGLAFVHGMQQACSGLNFVGCSSLLTIARLRPNELWFLPATKSQGYAALSADGVAVESWVVDLPNAGQDFVLMRSSDRAQVDLSQLAYTSCYSVLAWDLLELALKRRNHGLHLPKNLVNLASEIAYGMAEFGLLSLANGVESYQPAAEYYRRSAPEEALSKGDSR